LLLAVFVSFFLVVLMTPEWIRKCRNCDLLWEDMNKYKHPKNVASSGGVIVVLAFLFGSLFYVAMKTFMFGGTWKTAEIFALLTVILILGIIGLVDDLFGWKNGGLSKRFRTITAFFAAIPLVVINAGVSEMSLPLIGAVDFGIVYPLFLIPLGIAGASTTYNFLAGYNGLEAGQGILILGFLSFVAYATGSPWLAIIGLCMVAALIGFYLFNKYPAKVFPGDIMTYTVGAMIAGMAILGNFEKIAFVVFIPYILEVFLKLRGGLSLKIQSFGISDKNGYLKTPERKVYGLEHIAIRILNKFGKATERKVTYLIHAFQIIFILIAFFMIPR